MTLSAISQDPEDRFNKIDVLYRSRQKGNRRYDNCSALAVNAAHTTAARKRLVNQLHFFLALHSMTQRLYARNMNV
jgi:hypothetical protein